MAKWDLKFDSVAKVECGARESPLECFKPECPRLQKKGKVGPCVRTQAKEKSRLRVTFSMRSRLRSQVGKKEIRKEE